MQRVLQVQVCRTRPRLRRHREAALVLQLLRHQSAPVSHLQVTAPPTHRPAPPRDPGGGPLHGNNQDAGLPECLAPRQPHRRRGEPGCRVTGDAGKRNRTTGPPSLAPGALAGA